MAAVLKFNTGRFYSASGQRIAAKKLADGRVAFYDLDRNIDGVTRDPVPLAQWAVVNEYDHGRYSPGLCCTGLKDRTVEACLVRELKSEAETVLPLEVH